MLHLQVWIPQLVFTNSVEDKQIENDDFAYLMVKRMKPAMVKDIEIVNEDEYFTGCSNPLVLTRLYDLELQCQFQLLYYPFDYQHCYVNVSYLKILL